MGWDMGRSMEDTGVARLFDSYNDPDLLNMETVLEIEKESALEEKCDTIISFSHFLPRQELIPEKKMLFEKNLPKAVGSDFLMHRINSLQPNIHIFGHTHFSWDCVLEGVRYVQWPLAYPHERRRRRNEGKGWAPIIVYDTESGMTPCRNTYWCSHYNLHSENHTRYIC